jgi:hypothetical protein
MAVLTGCSGEATSPSAGTPRGSKVSSPSAPTPTANESTGSQDATHASASPTTVKLSADKKAASVGAKDLRKKATITIPQAWRVHGGGLTIQSQGTAVSTVTVLGSCGPPEGWCTHVMKLRVVQLGSTTVKLTVTAAYSHDTSNRRYPAGTSATAVGDYYLLVVRPHGYALTELHAPNGSLRVPKSEANSLGNPWLCSVGSADVDKRCGA